ncbi:MAG: hypothetical protein AABZ33_01380 [Chloroflexota bacterium]
MTELDTYAIPEAHDVTKASGFGDPWVHEVAMSAVDNTLAYWERIRSGPPASDPVVQAPETASPSRATTIPRPSSTSRRGLKRATKPNGKTTSTRPLGVVIQATRVSDGSPRSVACARPTPRQAPPRTITVGKARTTAAGPVFGWEDGDEVAQPAKITVNTAEPRTSDPFRSITCLSSTASGASNDDRFRYTPSMYRAPSLTT